MTWQRARSEEQKEKRVSEIVAATARLYEKYDFEDITFARIAREARFTRSNLYKYFRTKEEIFLALLTQDLVRFRRALARALRPGKVSSVEACAAVWTKTLIRHERLLRLFSILYTSLEKNSSLDSLTRFKRTARHELGALSEILCTLFPALTPEKAGEFLHNQGALATGLYPMAHLSEIQRQAMERAGFEQIGIDFEAHLRDAIEHLLEGLVG
jgi:AcrR family transcriptional regulator